jgi:hypothetical protein
MPVREKRRENNPLERALNSPLPQHEEPETERKSTKPTQSRHKTFATKQYVGVVCLLLAVGAQMAVSLPVAA